MSNKCNPPVLPTGCPSTPLSHHLLGEELAFSRWPPQVHGSLHLPVCCHRSWPDGLQEGPPSPELNCLHSQLTPLHLKGALLIRHYIVILVVHCFMAQTAK